MVEEVAHRDLLGRIGIVQLKGGIEVGDAGIPRDQPVADHRSNDRRGDGLGEGSELEHGIGVDSTGLAHFPHAEAAEIDDLVLVDDSNGEARHAAIGNSRLRELPELGDRREHLLLRRRLRRSSGAGHRRRQQDQCNCTERSSHGWSPCLDDAEAAARYQPTSGGNSPAE
jgi:hypothetical protein